MYNSQYYLLWIFISFCLHSKPISIFYISNHRLILKAKLTMFTYFASSRRLAGPCTFRGTWHRIRYTAPPVVLYPRGDPRTRSNRSAMWPSRWRICAASSKRSGRSSLAAFSCTRASSADAAVLHNQVRNQRIESSWQGVYWTVCICRDHSNDSDSATR